MSRPIASFEFNKQAIRKLKAYYAKLGNEVVRELTLQVHHRLEQDYLNMLNDYYRSYIPSSYDRTYTLFSSSYKISRQAKRGYGHITMFYQPDKMQEQYDRAWDNRGWDTQNAPLAEDVLSSFDAGWHGPAFAGIPFRYQNATPADYLIEQTQKIINFLCKENNRAAIVKRAAKRVPNG